MAAATPKQYLPLAGRTVIEWSLAAFANRREIDGIVLVLAAGDTTLATLLATQSSKVRTAIGGAERVDSVMRGLAALVAEFGAQDDDWVLVHDAARPCLHADDLTRLMESLAADAVGGLLASPVTDTLKRAGPADRVAKTVPREGIWRALTPQMFRLGPLRQALASASAAGVAVTDEASAMEHAGQQPMLIAGRSDNIKITVPEDLLQAEYILKSREAT